MKAVFVFPKRDAIATYRGISRLGNARLSDSDALCRLKLCLRLVP